MRTFTDRAYAKLNLTLDVLRRRPDGYHDMKMVMASCGLFDQLTLQLETAQPWSVSCASGAAPLGADNLCWKAADRFLRETDYRCDGLKIVLDKKIPMGAGTAGGSSDAAAVLRMLNRAYGAPFTTPELADFSAAIGSDVPYCVLGGTQLAEGRGEQLSRLSPLPEMQFLLCKPRFSISTPELFHAIDTEAAVYHPDTAAMLRAVSHGDAEQIAACLGNAFEPLAKRRFPVVSRILETMRLGGAMGAAMTGTGSCLFGVFAEQAACARCAELLKQEFPDTYVVAPINTMEEPAEL
ncbi:MAG: 4-(cytidine 5'-diphospho)-2-C-methyl-D-erythritol kinase [Oscillospiraceae bacterium]|nr:4-(cytidine 5'-diphospho)-2-C-methyl-D-erythritol kinase [Oscillospiraceae bacterium]